MTKIYESILDDLEGSASGQAAKKLRDDSLQKSKDDYDFTLKVHMKRLNLKPDVCATELTSIRDCVSDFLECCPNISSYSDVEFISSWPEITKHLLKNASHILYRRPNSGQEYELGLEVNVCCSFRRPLKVLYFLGQLYNVIKITKVIKLYEVVLTKNKDGLKPLPVSYDLIKYLAENRYEKIWSNVSYNTLCTIVKIANYIKPCLAAYTEVATKCDMINFNETLFVSEAFNTAAYSLNRKIVIPGYLYVQMEDAELSIDGIASFGKIDYFYHNLIDNIYNIYREEEDGRSFDREWFKRTFFDELRERPRKPVMIYAHAYKNIYLHLFISFGSFYDEKSQIPYLFGIDCKGYVLDEELIGEFAYNISHNLFNGQIQMSDFIKFIKETFPDNYAKQNRKS